MTIKEKLSALRAIMERESLDAYIISGTDPHNSEYLPAAWKQRQWISGFTGSFGTVVVLKNEAGLWTDTRYFIQAEKQLEGSGIQLHKLRVPDAVDYPEWLGQNLDSGSKVGLDSFCTSVNTMKHLQGILKTQNIKVVEKTDLLGELWLDRPALPENPVFPVKAEIAGKTIKEKLQIIQDYLAVNKADYYLFSSLDEIAWLYNIRCNDIPYNPVAISYAIVGRERSYWFVKQRKVSREITALLEKEGIEIRDYHHLFLFLDELPQTVRFCVDTNTLNYAVYHKIASKFPVTEKESPVILAKAIKNATEIAGIREACIKDSVAMTKFFYWMESNVSDSFGNISAYGKNAALPHYSAVRGKDAELQPHGLYLVDSGGQYTHGTTDITRTIPLGELTEQEKEDYTLVLQGMIDLSLCRFPKGTSGCNIDIIARQPLWQKLRNFGHGTGHGIGFFLNVHEGPQAIRQDLKQQPILPGMLTSDEPGLYREGAHGIRHENMILCVPVESNEFGEWLGFETLTLCYFDTSALLVELLSEQQKKWLNDYHRNVYEKTAPFLSPEEKQWLAEKTKPIQ